MVKILNYTNIQSINHYNIYPCRYRSAECLIKSISHSITKTGEEIQNHVYDIYEQIVQHRHVARYNTPGQRIHKFDAHFVQERLGRKTVRERHQDSEKQSS